MKLSEMLAYCAGEFLDDRTDLIDGDNDDLWSDDFLVRQFNYAQRMLCRRAWVIIEYGVSPVAVITLVTGKALYPYNKAILRVFDATPSSQVAMLGRTTDEHIRNAGAVGADAFDVGEAAALAGSAETGVPIAIATDAATRTIRVHPVPTAAQNGTRLYLKIARMPIEDLSLEDTDAEPEVPDEWHMDICHYAAGRALTLPNVDADQKPEGRRLLAEFDETVRLARQERERAEMSDNRWAFSSVTARLDW